MPFCALAVCLCCAYMHYRRAAKSGVTSAQKSVAGSEANSQDLERFDAEGVSQSRQISTRSSTDIEIANLNNQIKELTQVSLRASPLLSPFLPPCPLAACNLSHALRVLRLHDRVVRDLARRKEFELRHDRRVVLTTGLSHSLLVVGARGVVCFMTSHLGVELLSTSTPHSQSL